MKALLDEFAKRTSLHGCERTTDANRSFISRLMWLIFTLGMVGVLLWLVVDLYLNYRKYRTVTKINVSVENTLPFPAVTLCNLSPYSTKYVNVTPELHNYLLATSQSFSRYASPINWTEDGYRNLAEEDLSQWHDMASIRLKDTLIFCTLYSVDMNCSQLFTPTETDIGRCFTFNKEGNFSAFTSGSQSGMSVKINVHQDYYTVSSVTSAGVKVFVHGPKSQPSVYSEGTLVATGTENYIQITRTKYYFKPYPYCSTGTRYCVDTEDQNFKNPLKYHRNYFYYECMYECIYEPIFTKCGCAPPSQAERFNMTTCNRKQMLECILADATGSENRAETVKKCICGKPCTEEVFETITSSASSPSQVAVRYISNHSDLHSMDYAKNNFVELNIFYKDLATEEIIYEPEYTAESILVSLGGFLGLFLGCSILTVLEVLEFAVIIIPRSLLGKNRFKKSTSPSDSMVLS